MSQSTQLPVQPMQAYTGGRLLTPDALEKTEGNAEITRFYERYRDRGMDNWNFVGDVLTIALEFLSSPAKQLTQGDATQTLRRQEYDFLKDTLIYLRTGRRQLSLYTWSELLTLGERDEYWQAPAGELTALAKQIDVPMTRETVIQHWCGLPNGFGDLLFFLHVFYGVRHQRVDTTE